MTNKKDKAFKRTASENDMNKNVTSNAELVAENKRLKKEIKLIINGVRVFDFTNTITSSKNGHTKPSG